MLDRHCKLLLEKLEHRLVCYFVFGSFVRGTQRIDSDIDVWVVIDDSGVRNSPEREKNLRELNENCCRMARAAFAVARRVHVQTSVLSAFVQLLHSMDPLAVRLLSEGVPLHDRGLFSAWSRLLREGRLRSTRESLESRLNELVPMQSQAASSIQTLAKDLARPIKRGCIKFLELLLEVVYFPSAYYSEEGQVIDLVRAELVERRKLLTPEELDVARRAVEFQKRVEAGTMPSLEEALQLYRQAERLIGKAPAIFRQLMLERDHAQLEALIPRIEAALASTGVGDSGSGPQAWRERLQAFYDQARSALSATGDRGLAAVRTAALMARISDIAPSVMDAESGRDPSDRTTLGVGTGPATGQPHRRTFADEQSAVHP
jgi:predicted nucleotidyltransferase